jgi:hypothetical protein
MNSLWDILSVAIGISFIFMILSILNSWVQEYIATVFDLRAKNLADIMQNLLEPGTQELNGDKRARTEFKSELESPQGQILRLLRGGEKTLKKEAAKRQGRDQQALQTIGETLDRLGDTTEKIVQQTTAPIAQLGKTMKAAAGIVDLLIENPVRTLYMHPIVHSLSKPNRLPDSLPTKDFTVALLDLLDDAGRDGNGKMEPSEEINIDCIKQGIKKLEDIEFGKQEGDTDPAPPNYQLGYRLRSLLYTAQIHAKGKPVGIGEFQNAVSEWFDDTVARGSVWYKRRMQRVGIVCGFLLAIVLNADTIGLSNALWHNAILRESLVQSAQTAASQGKPPEDKQAPQQWKSLMDLGLPLGWTLETVPVQPATDTDAAAPLDPRLLPSTPGGWIGKIVGLLVTGFAISQGSQIWFDLMKRLLNVRSSALQPASEEQTAKDKSK